MFDAFLEDPSIGVRVAAMKAACSFLQDAVGSGDDSEGGLLARGKLTRFSFCVSYVRVVVFEVPRSRAHIAVYDALSRGFSNSA